MTTQSMDERIRAKAKRALEVEIDNTLKPLFDKLRNTQNRSLVVQRHDGGENVEVRLDMWAQLKEVQNDLVTLLAPAAGDAAVEEFVEKVESLQEQIDTLQQ